MIHSFTLEEVRNGYGGQNKLSFPQRKAKTMKATTLQTHITLFWTTRTEQFLWNVSQTQWMEKWLAEVMYICINKAQENSRESFLTVFRETRLWLHYL